VKASTAFCKKYGDYTAPADAQDFERPWESTGLGVMQKTAGMILHGDFWLTLKVGLTVNRNSALHKICTNI